MDGGITDSDRSTMLRAAVAAVGRDELKTALERAADPRMAMPTAIANALNALRKHRDPPTAVTRPPYRAALPYVAVALAEPCLQRTIEVLGEHADEPTREQLDDALDVVLGEFPLTTVAVMLASVADADMPASDLCFDVLDAEERFGLTGWAQSNVPAPATTGGPKPAGGATPEQREERRLKKQRDAEARRTKQEAARRAGEQARRVRRKERPTEPPTAARTPGAERRSSGGVARLTRRAVLTPLLERDFDRDDPWATGVVFAWVPFGGPSDPDAIERSTAAADSETEGKVRPCVVVAGSPTHLLVRPGYSDGGVKSRDWKSVPLRGWRQSGFDRPTWVDVELVAVDRRPVEAPVGWLTPEDWNSLW